MLICSRRSVLRGLVVAPIAVRAGLVMPISTKPSYLTATEVVNQQYIVAYRAWGGLGGVSDNLTTLYASSLQEAVERATRGLDQFEVTVAGFWPVDVPALNWTPARMGGPPYLDAGTENRHNLQN